MRKIILCGILLTLITSCSSYNSNKSELEELYSFDEYEAVDWYTTNSGIYKIKNNEGLVGYINHQGDMIIEPKYQDGLFFFDNISIVAKEGEDYFSYINQNGEDIFTNIDFDNMMNLFEFRNNVATLEEKGVNGQYLVNSAGEVIFNPNTVKYSEKHYKTFFDNTFINVYSENNYLYAVDSYGNIVENNEEPLYIKENDTIGFYRDTITNNFGLYNIENDEKLTEDIYSTVTPFYNGYAVVNIFDENTNKNDFYDENYYNNIVIINTQGDIIKNITERYKYVPREKYLHGFIAFYEYDLLTGIVDDRIILNSDNNSLVLNEKGELITDEYTIYSVFKEGVATITDNGKYGYINKDGEVILKPIYDYVSAVTNGIGLVLDDNVLYKVDLNKVH